MRNKRSSAIGVIVSKGGNNSKVRNRIHTMGVYERSSSEPEILDTRSHKRFVDNIFSLREEETVY